jgi:uncharacterized delta-60 repeat protein
MKSLQIFTYILFIFFSAIAISAQCVPASTAAGALDTCFDGDGKVTIDITPKNDYARAVVIQPDGKIVVAGTAGIDSAGASDFAVVRYNRDGSLDTTFDGDGVALTDIGSEVDDIDNVAGAVLQADGKIVVFGDGKIFGATWGFSVVRYNTDGSLDTTFSGDGKATFTPLNTFMSAHDVAIQPDGKIVGVGRRMGGDVNAAIVVRFNTDGSLDTSFDSDGSASVPLSAARTVALQPSGKIVVAGDSGFTEMGVARLNTDGSLDTFFGTNGVVVYGPNLNDFATRMAVRAGADIFVCGSASPETGVDRGSLVRFTSEGSFPTGTIYFEHNSFNTVAIESDLKVLTGGSSRTPNWGFTIRRHIETNLDTSFNSGAVAVKFFPDAVAQSAGVASVTTQRDNKIVAAGSTTDESVMPTSSRFAVTRLMSGLQAPHPERFDFDGDGKADVSVFRPSENRWYVFRSSDFGVTEQFYGQSGDRPVPADYDGDGKTDFAIFRNGVWGWLSSMSGTEDGFQWGSANDIPRVSDFNGEGKADFVVFRPGQNFWYRKSLTGEFSNQNFGLSGDKPVVGDFDGDGKSDKAIFRPSTGDWWYQSSINNAQLAVHWGISTDVPAPGDYDGDGKTDFAVYRPETGIWYIINSSNFSFTIINFGLAEDKPVPADYDGDGKVDIAVFRPSTGVWYMLRSTAGFAAMQFGISTDIPTPNAYIY